jgi:hypothetical protein
VRATQGHSLGRALRADKLNTLSWVDFRHLVKVLDWLRVNLADLNAVYFGPRGFSYRKRDGRAKDKDTPGIRFVEASKYA